MGGYFRLTSRFMQNKSRPQTTSMAIDLRSMKNPRSQLINNSRWRGQRFGPATRREEGASPQWGCDRRTTTWPAQRSAAPLFFSPQTLFHFVSLFFVPSPLQVFVRWLVG